MKYRITFLRLWAAIVLGVGLAACSGGSSHRNSPLVPAAVLMTSRQTATGTVTVTIPRRLNTTSKLRNLAYISASTGHVALFINGAATAAGSASSCSVTCTIPWSVALAVPASYTFAVEIDTGSAGSPANTVLAEGSASYAIHSGVNALSTLTLNGVAASASIGADHCLGGANTFCNATVTVADAAGNAITSPGNAFDNSSVTLGTSNANGAVTAGSSITTVSGTGTYSYKVSCQTPTGTFDVTASPGASSAVVTPAELAGLVPAVTYPSTIPVAVLNGVTYICQAGDSIGKAYFLTSGTSFTTPSDWVSTSNTIAVISGGGGGQGRNPAGGGGGGGGGYSALTNTALLAPSTTYTYAIGAGGAGGTNNTPSTAGGDTWFCQATGTCTTDAGTGVIVAAGGGGGGANTAGGTAGVPVTGTGFSGGVGGSSSASSGAGGGAAGPFGAGGAGGVGASSTLTYSPGGGGNGGGSAGSGGTGTGGNGNGGNNVSGTGGGAAGSASSVAVAGTNGGGGGGGGTGVFAAGAAGGNGTDWNSLFGSGGGGGASSAAATGGAGGLYGGGGGGTFGSKSATGGAGGQGLIVVIYKPT